MSPLRVQVERDLRDHLVQSLHTRTHTHTHTHSHTLPQYRVPFYSISDVAHPVCTCIFLVMRSLLLYKKAYAIE